jgi:cytochrome P450
VARHDDGLTILREGEVFSVGGVEIPSGHKVLVSYAGANRDPRRWDDPNRFDIRRKTSGQMGYGVGIHVCVGLVIARMECGAV